MSEKPQIFAHCTAGCSWETVHKSDFLRAVQYVEIPIPESGTVELEVGAKYKIYADKNAVANWATFPAILIGTEEKDLLDCVWPMEVDGYRKYYYVEILEAEWVVEESTSMFGVLKIVYEFNGVRKTIEIDNVYIGSTYTIQISNANKIYWYNVDAVELIGENGEDGKDGSDGVDGKTAYDIAVENGYAGTEAEFGYGLAKAAGTAGWTEEQITLLETIFANIAYTDETTGQAAADALIASLRGGTVVTVTGLLASYTGGTVAAGTTLDSLKNDLTVTATYSDGTTATVTDYTLSGSLIAGQTNIITVTYKGKTATFGVTVEAAEITVSVSGGSISTNATSLTVSDGNIILS